MPADPAVLTIPAEIREPLDAACFVFPEEAYTGGSLRGLSSWPHRSPATGAPSFATRERGRRLAEEVLVFERAQHVTVDFTDAITAPSFLQGFLARSHGARQRPLPAGRGARLRRGVRERPFPLYTGGSLRGSLVMAGVDEQLLPLAERVAKASGIDHKVTVEGVPAATAGT